MFPHTDSVLPDTVSCLLMPPFLGSRSGDRERSAMAASRDDGKGTSRELQGGQGRPEEPRVSNIDWRRVTVYKVSTPKNRLQHVPLTTGYI